MQRARRWGGEGREGEELKERGGEEVVRDGGGGWKGNTFKRGKGEDC